MNIDLMKVVQPPFNAREAIVESKRCLHCKTPLCVTGCPISMAIPDFIHQVSMGNMGEAMSIINRHSNLPAICGRVCPHEQQCQGHCILAKQGKPIHIGRIESFVADFDTEMNLTREKLVQKTRGRVAIIGSGPAGLTVAGTLAREGFSVTIYEGQDEPGGVLMYGIPAYRLPKEVVKAEIHKIEALGVELKLGHMVGLGSLTIDSIFAEGFDAIFIGSGTALPKDMEAPGSRLQGIVQSVYFLHQVASYNAGAIGKERVPIRDGEKVAVIGGGNTAIDAARTALRFGNDVTIIYRRTQAEMPANRSEYEEAVAEGVHFIWQSTAEEFYGNGAEQPHVSAIRVKNPECETVMPFQRVFLAIGARPANKIVATTDGINVDDKGYILTQEVPFGMTSRRGVFAGGDVVHRPQTVVLAMKAAKEISIGIAQYVDAVKLMQTIEKSNK